MAKNTTHFFLFLFVIIFSFSSQGQTVTWNTVTQGTGVNYGNNGSGGITFVVENTAGFPAVLQEVSNYFTSTGTSNVELWYSSTSLSGLPGTINATNGWTQITTGSVSINNSSPLNATVGTLNTLFSGLNFIIPAGTTYRFHITSSVTVEYTGTSSPTGAVPLTFSQQGVNLHIGEYQIGGQNVGIGGNTTGAVNNPRAFTGQIVLNLLSTPCSGQPTAGTTTASTNTPCPGTPVNFALVGASQASGLSYQWIRANNSNGPWVNLPGATNATYSTTTLGTRCFRCIVTCLSNGLFDTSSTVCVVTQPWTPTGTCWCVPQYTTGGVNNLITNFTLDNLNNTTTLASNVSPFWVDYTSAQSGSNPTLPIPNLYVGLTANANLTFGSATNNFSAIWIDFNHNGAFDTTEYFTANANAGANGSIVIPINTPVGALSGVTRLRIRGGHSVQMTNAQACGFTASTVGEAEDYLVNIVPASAKDPAITAIAVPSGNCLSNNETVTATLTNFGNTNINLLLDSVKVTLRVNGPSGLVTYVKKVNTGALFTYGSNSIPVVFTGVNLYAGGTYFINTSVAFAPPGGGASNVVTINDSLFAPKVVVNYRPIPGPDLHVCKNSPILFGQGLSVSGCANPIYDSVELVFNVTPCADNVGATSNGTSQTVPGAGCANMYACDFANVTLPTLPNGAYFTQDALLTVTNLASNFRNEVRFNVYGPNPNPPYAPLQQGYTGPVGNMYLAGQSVGSNTSFFNRRYVTTSQLGTMFANQMASPTVHVGYFETWNDIIGNSDLTPNALGAPTEVKLKIWYAYVPARIKWYDNASSTVLLDTLVPFNPLSPTVLSPTTQMINTGTVGTYTFFATCDGVVDCRVPVNLIVDPIPAVFQDTISLCESAVGSNQAIFDLTTLNSSVSGGTFPLNSVDYFGDQALFGPIATPTNDTSGTVFVYSKVTNSYGCYSSDSVLLNVNSIPEFSPNVVSGNACAPSTIDIDNLIGAFSTVPIGCDTLYFDDPACTVTYAGNPHVITSADTVYMVFVTNTLPSCSDTAVAFVNISQATNMIVNQVVPGNYSDCQTPISCGNVTLTDGGVQTLFTTPDCRKVANVTDVVNSIDLGSTQICETIDCSVQTHNGQPYVNRVYQITPTTNDSGTVCLYYLDDDFDQYNAYALVNNWPLLPVGSMSALVNNIAISRVENGPVTTLGSYIGATIPNNLINTSYDPSTTVWTVCFPTDSFSHFYLHTLNPGNVPLPVSLEFSGKRVEGSSVLSWITSMERNNSHFVVERSRDGGKFSPISDKINSKATQGNSSSPLSYGYTDASPNNGHNYYRLQQNDIDGHQSYSKVVDIYFGSDIMVTMYPNPVKTTLHVDISTPKATLARTSIIDAAGRIVRQVDLHLQAGSNASELDMQGLADGMYQIRICNDKGLDYTQTIRKN